MGMLVKFELRKIVGNKAGMGACALALALLAALSVLNLLTAETRDAETGALVEGIAAQSALQRAIDAHAGMLTDERVATDLVAIDRSSELASTVVGFEGMSSEEIIAAYGLDFWRDTIGVMTSDYYYELGNAMEAADQQANSLRDGARARLDLELSAASVDGSSFSDAERDYWNALSDQVSWPIEYGYAGGWKNVLDWASFSGLAIVALCLALAGVYASEYQSRTAAVALPTRRGKRAFPAAKAIAAFIFATGYWWLCAAVVVGVNVAVCGADGWSLPLQSVFGFDNPYPLTVGQAVLAVYALGYLVALGMAAFTLLLSATMRSTMPVATIPMALVFLGMFALFITPLAKMAALTPMSGLNYAFDRLVSYAAGPIVISLPTLMVWLYAAMFVICIPLAIRAFRRHQVA